ncbi:MAG: LysR family transcriptional regulator [Gammaproteobacteria bacterium]|jgi:DNA-binding transcriptional LysR family regulator
MQHINWDNLRYVLVVANKGSISAAARELGVNRTTVLRRINRFQQDLNCRIFDRGDGGYAMTPEAEKMINAAREVENTLFDMQRQIAGRELRLEGEVRVTTTDSFILSVLGPHLSSFSHRHPHIVIDLLVTNSILDLNRRDADVAIRPTGQPEGNLVGRRLCDIEFGFYALPELVAETPPDLSSGRWIGFADDLAKTPVGSWFGGAVDQRNISARCDSFVGLRCLAEAGIGLALLPCLLGDDSPLLRRASGPVAEITTGLWILTHPDLVRSARVHAFIDHFSEALGSPGSGLPRSPRESSPGRRNGAR